MESPERSQPRVLARLVATSSTVFGLAVGAHLAGGGAVPDGLALGVLAALTLAWCAVLAQRRLRVSTLLPAAAVWQWVLHEALSLASASATSATATASGHAGHGGVVDLSATAAALVHHHAASVPMLAAHVAATLATVALLVATERGAERALERWSWALPVLSGAAGPLVRVTRAGGPVPVAESRARTSWVLGTVGSRGPPCRGLPA